jgi:hypothetical protein
MKSTSTQAKHSEIAATKARIQFELKRILEDIFERPGFDEELYLPLEKSRAIALFRGLVYRAIDEPQTELAAGLKALTDGIAALELKASLPHGVIGKVYGELPVSPRARATMVRESNRLVEMPKGWLGFREGGPQREIEVSDVRHDPQLRKALASGDIFDDMRMCGSEKTFRAKFCPSSRRETPKAKCLRALAQVERWTEDLDSQDLPEVHERLASVCQALSFVSATASSPANEAQIIATETKLRLGCGGGARKRGPAVNGAHRKGRSGRGQSRPGRDLKPQGLRSSARQPRPSRGAGDGK